MSQEYEEEKMRLYRPKNEFMRRDEHKKWSHLTPWKRESMTREKNERGSVIEAHARSITSVKLIFKRPITTREWRHEF
jgi:hypothetical protein